MEPKRAIDYYYKALQINPDINDAYINLGNIFSDLGQGDLAIKCYHQALQINPNQEAVLNAIGVVLDKQYQRNESETYFRKALLINPIAAPAFSNLLLSMCYRAEYDMQSVFSEHKKFAVQFDDPLLYALHTNARSPARKLRIGYVSPDFRKHSVAYFIEPVLMNHDKEHFEVFCYANHPLEDEVTERLRGYADHWRKIPVMPDTQALELIRQDGIDILIDLAGHTAFNRLLMFARKPAPVQISWIGYPATTGLSAIDYRIVDAYTDPPGMTEQFNSEKLLRMPESFLCYLPDRDSPGVKSLPALSAGHITFGSFNKLSKITPDIFSLWAGFLREIPNSSMVLKTYNFADKRACQKVTEMFAREGFASDRFLLMPHVASTREHLELYSTIDIALDTYPYNGTTTTCEALWMGVPVITLAGHGYGSRVGASLLSNVGLSDLIATTYEEYRNLVIALAGDRHRLQALRGGLRDMMACSPLTDAKRFTGHLEECYRRIWKEWCREKIGAEDSKEKDSRIPGAKGSSEMPIT
jgi:predicted O-linked N-acetylglucosamine transferase (SPINDLY family)